MESYFSWNYVLRKCLQLLKFALTLVDKVVQCTRTTQPEWMGENISLVKKKQNCWFWWRGYEETNKLKPLLELSLAEHNNLYTMQVLYNGNHFRLVTKILTPSLGASVRSQHAYFCHDVLKHSACLLGIILTSTKRTKATLISLDCQ